MKKIWFKVGDLQCKVRYIIDGWYDGMVQVKEQGRDNIFIVAPNEIEIIKEIENIEEDERET